ncbi:MAG: alcohol dehydrogenase catalytic domain-containing protein [Planctomycetota bacterium]
MKAAVYHGIRDVRVEEVETPSAGPGEIVVRVLRCAVCGTDKRVFLHGQKNVVPPAVTGHEIVGTVHELGEGVDGPPTGARVVVATPIGCGECIYCRREQYNLCEDVKPLGYDYPGGFAEYVKVPARGVEQGNVIPIPDELDPDAAALIEPLSCVLNGQEYVDAQPGDRALVFGAGPIGLMHAAVFRTKGCRPVVVADVAADRLEFVRELELGTPVHTTSDDPTGEILEPAGGERFDCIVTACSVKAVQGHALRLARKKARVSFFAGVPKDDPVLPVDTNHIHYNEISVFGAFASNNRHYRQAAEMVARGDLPADRFVTHKFPLDQIADAYETIVAGRGIKIVIDCE